MEGKNHRPVRREQFVEILVFHAMGMLRLGLQHHQVDHVDDPDADIGNIFAQQRHRGQCLQGRHIAGTGHHHIGIVGIIAGPVPDAGARDAMADRRIDIEPLPFRLFAGDDQVDVVAAAQAVIGHRQQAVGIGRQVDAHDVGLLVGDMVDEAGILMRKAVVVLSPDMRGQKVVERGDRFAPAESPC